MGAQAIDGEGLMWHAGAVTATAEPVIYSVKKTVSQLTFALRRAEPYPGDTNVGTNKIVRSSRDDGEGALDEDERVASITDAEAPFEVTWEDENASSTDFRRVGGIEPGDVFVHVTGSAFADGTAGPTFAGTGTDRPYHMRLDNRGPGIKNLHLAMRFSQQYDITNWVGAAHRFTFSDAATTPDFTDGGVGRNRIHHEYRAGTGTADLQAVAAPRELDETDNNRAYVLLATVRDRLGNETVRWWAGADSTAGLPNTSANRRLVDRTADFRFGVDLTAPTQKALTGAAMSAADSG